LTSLVLFQIQASARLFTTRKFETQANSRFVRILLLALSVAECTTFQSNMPRRPPPSSLLLAQGPLPSRGQPKHTLPSLPRPALSPFNASRAAGPSRMTRPAGRERSNSVEDAMVFSVCNRSYSSTGANHWPYMMEQGSRFSSLESFSDSTAASRRGSLDSSWSPNHSRPTTPHHSSSESDGRSSSPSLAIDVDVVLALPKPVAISP